MSRRSRAREVALQLLYQQDQNKKPMKPAAAAEFARGRLPGDPEAVTFCLALVAGVAAKKEAIDATLTTTAENWRLSRMLPSDRNVLRLGTYELLHADPPEPVPVVLNEAIELARRFGTADSPGFVNGILDRVAKGRKADGGSGNEEPPPAEPAPAP
jgi:N utilization substance protein B